MGKIFDIWVYGYSFVTFSFTPCHSPLMSCCCIYWKLRSAALYPHANRACISLSVT